MNRLTVLSALAAILALAIVLGLAAEATAPASALPPFTPTFLVTADEVAPDDLFTLPADDDCPVGAPCKFHVRIQIPDGQPNGTGTISVNDPAFLAVLPDAQIPDGAVTGRTSGTVRVGPVGACIITGGPIFAFDRLFFEATTDPATTTGAPSDLISFDRWPSQLNDARDAFIADNPGAVLHGRQMQRNTSGDSFSNALLFKLSDGSFASISIEANPEVAPTFEICGPIDINSISLGLTADNPDTPADESGFPRLVCLSAGVKVIFQELDREDTPPGDPVLLQDTVTCSPNTPQGMAVSVPLNGGTEAVAGLTVTFAETTSAGTTTVVTSQGGPPPPTGFNITGLNGVPLYFDISTTANFTGDVEVCISYDDTGLTAAEEDTLQLMQEVAGAFVDRTSSLDTVSNIICGTAPSFSVWAVLLPLDSDSDGVLDPQDLCPGTAAGAAVDANGCADAQVDGDGDGVCDPGAPSAGPAGCTGSDACPAEDATGFDADNDGCIDSIQGFSIFVDTLFVEGVIDPSMQNSLHAKIDAALASLNRDNVCTAISGLEALKNQIEAQTGKKVSQDAAIELLQYITNVQTFLVIASGVTRC